MRYYDYEEDVMDNFYDKYNVVPREEVQEIDLQMDRARDAVKAIINDLTVGKQAILVSDFAPYLEDLCDDLEIKFPSHLPKTSRPTLGA